jgi:hypothetical protein
VEIKPPIRRTVSAKVAWIIVSTVLVLVVGVGIAVAPAKAPGGGSGQPWGTKALSLMPKQAQIKSNKQVLCDDGFSKDIYDLSANNLDASKILPYALCHGTVPNNTPEIAATSSRMVQGFIARLKAELWLRENDPDFSKYAGRLDAGLSEMANEKALQDAIDYLGLGKASSQIAAFRPYDLANSPEKAQECIRLTEQVSKRQFIVFGASPIKLITYLRLSRDGNEDPLLLNPKTGEISNMKGGRNG